MRRLLSREGREEERYPQRYPYLRCFLPNGAASRRAFTARVVGVGGG